MRLRAKEDRAVETASIQTKPGARVEDRVVKITLISLVRGGGHRLYSSGFNRSLIFIHRKQNDSFHPPLFPISDRNTDRPFARYACQPTDKYHRHFTI